MVKSNIPTFSKNAVSLLILQALSQVTLFFLVTFVQDFETLQEDQVQLQPLEMG